MSGPTSNPTKAESGKQNFSSRWSPWLWLAAAAGTAVVGTTLLGAFAPADILNALASDQGVTKSVPYASGPRRTLDVYRPRGVESAPVIVFFYGGSWQGGAKETYRFVGSELASQGFLTVIPDYRVYPEVRYPTFLEDGAKAVAWARANAARFGGDGRKLIIMGHSAGAYMAAMLAIDRRWLKQVNLDPRRDVAGLVGISGPYDFLPLRDQTLVKIFGGNGRRSTQPITYVRGGEPPTLLAQGAADKTVDPGNATRLAARMRAVGDEVIVKRYAGVGHAPMIGAFSPLLHFIAPVLSDTEGFIERVTTRNSGAAELNGSAQP